MESARSLRVLVAAFAAAASLTVAPAAAGPLSQDSCRLRLAAAPATPVGVGPCAGVRPGAYVGAPEGGCTLGFLFSAREPTKDGWRTMRYIATAGHCVLEDPSEEKWRYNEGPAARDPSGAKIGEFVYANLNYRGAIIGPHRDFALIRLDPGVKSRARMCHFGGPTGINNDVVDEPVVVHHYGHGLGFGPTRLVYDVTAPGTVPARSSLARLNDPDVAGGTGTINYGDSGSPVITGDGRAVGLIVQFVEETGPGAFGMTRLRPQIVRAQNVLGVDLTLLTATLR